MNILNLIRINRLITLISLLTLSFVPFIAKKSSSFSPPLATTSTEAHGYYLQPRLPFLIDPE